MVGQPFLITKVRAGFYRVGVLCIHKGHYWCVYLGADFLPNARFRTLQDAAWWASHNQPKAQPVKTESEGVMAKGTFTIQFWSCGDCEGVLQFRPRSEADRPNFCPYCRSTKMTPTSDHQSAGVPNTSGQR